MNLYLKKAEISDLMLLYDWRNEECVRLNSFNSEIIRFEDHERWFVNKLKSETSDILILCNEEIAVGQIRVDRLCNKLEISYSIDYKFRGNGYGKQAIKLVEEFIKENYQINTVIGKVKKSNIPSIKAFEANNYRKQEEEDYLIFIKKL